MQQALGVWDEITEGPAATPNPPQRWRSKVPSENISLHRGCSWDEALGKEGKSKAYGASALLLRRHGTGTVLCCAWALSWLQPPVWEGGRTQKTTIRLHALPSGRHPPSAPESPLNPGL